MTTRIGYVTIQLRALDDYVGPLREALGASSWNAWLENSDDPAGLCIRDDVQPDEVSALIDTWREGRLFTRQGDVQWQKQSHDKIHLVVMVTTTMQFPGVQLHELKAMDQAADGVEQDSILAFWGERRAYPNERDQYWIEGRIPDLDRLYPDTWQKRFANLIVRMYTLPWPEAGTVRTVVRYLDYQHVDERPDDPRLKKEAP